MISIAYTITMMSKNEKSLMSKIDVNDMENTK